MSKYKHMPVQWLTGDEAAKLDTYVAPPRSPAKVTLLGGEAMQHTA